MSISSGNSGARRVEITPDATYDTVGVEEVRHTALAADTGSVPPARRDKVRWGPVWAGLIVALASFLLFELAAFALGWLTPGEDSASRSGWVSGLLGLLAFFLGGLTAGATALWRDVGSGLLHGVLVWALGVVAIILITTLGGGALFGALADTLARVANLSRGNLPNVDATQALDTARSAAGWGVLGLALSLAAAAAGGLVGGNMWPRKGSERERLRLPA